ncbi:glycosyltransferase [Luteipulveratus mongoliensis]|nr:glycosyltransferase [Luteipulveratus mongoliensis]
MQPSDVVDGPPSEVVMALGFSTWGDARRRDFGFSPDRMARALLEDPDIADVTVVDAFRSRLGRAKNWRQPRAEGFPHGPDRRIVHPLRWARRDPLGQERVVRHYRSLDRRLATLGRRRSAAPVLVTCHPVHAAVADRSVWRDVVYYAWDDWLSYPLMTQWRPVTAWAYSRMAAQRTNVIGVTPAIIDRIGSERSTVIPNGVDVSEVRDLPAPPAWFDQLRRPVAFYSGSLQQRVDTDAIAAAARDLPDWDFCLVGPMVDPRPFDQLAAVPNVHIHERVPRAEVLAMAAAASVCLVPHRRTEMTVAMSPLKLYEYAAVGTPIVATDLPSIRGVTDRMVLVEPGAPQAAAILAAAQMPPADQASLWQWRLQHDWSNRYVAWRAAALSTDAARTSTYRREGATGSGGDA